MTCGKMRAITNHGFPVSPLRFVHVDGTELHYEGHHLLTQNDAHGKPQRVPEIVVVLKPAGWVPASAAELVEAHFVDVGGEG